MWAPRARRVDVVIEAPGPAVHALDPAPGGYFAATIPRATPVARYRYRLDGEGPYPDPCARFQPEGPHGPSQVVDANDFVWNDREWAGIGLKGQVIYEMHIGTFTAEGTFDAAVRELPALRDLGVTVLELMPVAEFAGRWNWGYDGVALYAPFHGYGDPHALRRFVDAAHRVNLAVILDVVYNHVGPDGNYLATYSPHYFSERHRTDWGPGINFDGEHSAAVRDFFVRNAAYWIADFHLDGLRLDATQTIRDDSRPHILAEASSAARAAAGSRRIILVAENEPQDAACLDPATAGGYGLDGMWNDDFHHSARVALTGRRDGYFHDYRGAAQEFVSAAKHGFLYQGQRYAWQRQPRGTPVLDRPAWSMIVFTQNHDQVANTLDGRRLHHFVAPGRLRAIVALALLAPQTPMLFMGEEFAASQPFPFFADHCARLHTPVHEGRREFLSQFAPYATPAAQARVPDPCAPATFRSAKLDFAERRRNAQVYGLYHDLLKLRREDPVIAAQARTALDGAVLAPHAFVLRFFDARHGDRLLAVNLGPDLHRASVPEPLVAPPLGARWRMAWSSEEPRYGGQGAIAPCTAAGWHLPADSAVLLRAEPGEP
ncbi:MAG TPA: malto-oligosyltrehalose trehalohydrolase [Burkholderiales bacterium]|nr:malto-oligosyltrehalose trehalohydrolase [Burkholderiales bacterium]